MTLRRVVLLIGLTLTMWCSTGCTVEGWRDGVNDGVASAIAAIIQAPVDHVLNQAFAEE